MTFDRLASTASVIDVLDHVLDKGIVIDAWVRVSLAGIDLVTVEARVVVASIRTYLASADALSQLETVSRPLAEPERRPLTTAADHLRRVREQMDRHEFAAVSHRRVEDRVREELRDARAKTVKRH